MVDGHPQLVRRNRDIEVSTLSGNVLDAEVDIYCLLRPKSPNSLSLDSKNDVLTTSITEKVSQITDPCLFSIEVRSRMTRLRHLPEIRSLLRFWRQNSNFEKDVGETWSRRGQDVGTFYVVETWSKRRHFLRGRDVVET